MPPSSLDEFRANLLSESGHEWGGAMNRSAAEPNDRQRRLCACAATSQAAGRRAAEKRDELAPFHDWPSD
jgi:hypothetical protein